MVYEKIFTSEDNKIVESFAVKDGKFVYVGDKAVAEAFIDKNTTEVIDYTDKGLVMPSCGNGHAHYSLHSIKTVGTILDREDRVDKFLNEIVPSPSRRQKTPAQRQFSVEIRLSSKKICRLVNNSTLFATIFQCTLPNEEGHKGIANIL